MQDLFLSRRNVVVLLILSVPLINNNPHNSSARKTENQEIGGMEHISIPSFPPDRARLSTRSGKPRIPHQTSSSSSFSRSSVLQLHALKRAPLASKPNHFALNSSFTSALQGCDWKEGLQSGSCPFMQIKARELTGPCSSGSR